LLDAHEVGGSRVGNNHDHRNATRGFILSEKFADREAIDKRQPDVGDQE